MKNIEEQIITILKEINEEIPLDTSKDLLEAGIIDSFDMVNIIAGFEQVFKIVIDPEDILPTNFNSIDNMAKLLSLKYAV